MAEWDPVLPPDKAGEYCGCSAKTLERLSIERHPIPQTGAKTLRWGYRLSVLNRFLETLSERAKNPQSRAPALVIVPPGASARRVG